ncbi:hypothetical protein PHYSODRAFT_292825 [Phytophthora sojae]|uniref:RxLR effector protein n=2 Tax=Phytophthora sojae TaxID=67593 RepID=G5AJH6_PHYSP|nr:hypothetical protein PHYSODRAFT_292825 [Phytophthora sojae]AEK80877.1 Avh192a1 [Phytophthora sojae]AEK80879.1 Avh192a1 [Phytophthora sojae]EGZ04325.1 hypothetical protein PHYSODRAFT_292825 [Phytophthora sojae]|eukprot:XP_009540227.1 hypothetical protein PHYSODRAFT_292825 [Phytophthora sojae]
MRSYYLLLVATAALLAASEALVPTTKLDRTVEHPINAAQKNAERFLRTDNAAVLDDVEEERAFANIKGIARTQDEATEWLEHWLGKRLSIEKVANELEIFRRNKSHVNWDALIKYTQMTHKRYVGEDMTRKQAVQHLKTILPQ